jgi:DNA-binding transcriptional LysR family regulator
MREVVHGESPDWNWANRHDSTVDRYFGEGQVRSQDGVVRGRLHLGILQSLTPYVQLAMLLQRFRSSYPEVEFAVRALPTETTPALVRSGYVDLSFHAVIGKEQWPGLQMIPYVQDSLVAICSRNMS